MLAPFLIMLREGMEAAVIVGIIATYLHRTGRAAFMPAVWTGVLLAVALSLFAGAALQVLRAGYPQKSQEAFEAGVALIATGMLLWMVVWMRANARSLSSTLRGSVDDALGPAGGAGPRSGAGVWPLVGAAFLAVAREGLESVFFLLAIFQQSPGAAAPLGALAGLGVAVGLGIALYRGGVRLDLQRFFRWTGVFVILVAAGLFSGALRSLHEAGVWNHLQQPVYDLTRTLPVSSVPGTILSGLLGYHDRPTLGEALAWLAVAGGGLWLFLRPVAAAAAPRLRTQG